MAVSRRRGGAQFARLRLHDWRKNVIPNFVVGTNDRQVLLLAFGANKNIKNSEGVSRVSDDALREAGARESRPLSVRVRD